MAKRWYIVHAYSNFEKKWRIPFGRRRQARFGGSDPTIFGADRERSWKCGAAARWIRSGNSSRLRVGEDGYGRMKLIT